MPKRGQMAYFAKETLKIIYGAVLVGCVTLLQGNHKTYYQVLRPKAEENKTKLTPPPPPKSKIKQNKCKALNDKALLK